MPEPMIAQTLIPMISAFAGCFTAPTFESFRWLISGWILCIGRHTVTGVIRAANAVGVKHHTSFHRFFRAANWSADRVGLCLLKLVTAALPKEMALVIAVDDTLSRHTGNGIRGASMHRDPLLSTQTKAIYHWGHVWVVFAVVLRIPKWKKSFALPVLCRLYRSEKVCKEQEHCFYKKTELAQQMIAVVAEALPNRHICIVGDNAYTNGAIIKKLPENVHYLGRARMDAALYALPEQKRGPGRPRVKGKRVPSPAQRAEDSDGWRSVSIATAGHDEVTLQVKVFNAIWYRVSRGRQMRFALIRGWPGHQHDDVLATTDLSLSVEEIIELFCLRWSIEVTFHEVKDKLGFEEPENRTDLAVERTAPMALWVFTLTVLWYLRLDKRLKSAKIPQFPWYEKTTPAFSDMLAALRRETWLQTISDQPGFSPKNQNSVDTLLYEAAYAS